jgi:hypothetical protein
MKNEELSDLHPKGEVINDLPVIRTHTQDMNFKWKDGEFPEDMNERMKKHFESFVVCGILMKDGKNFKSRLKKYN